MDHGSVPTHNHGKVIIYPLGFFLHLFCSFPHPENLLAAVGGGGGCSGSPGQGGGHSLAPCPANRVRESGTQDPAVPTRPSCLPLRSGSSLCFVFCLFWGGDCGFWVWFFCFSSSAGQIPSAAKRRRDNQPLPRPELAKPWGSWCPLRQGKQPWAPQNPAQGETSPSDAPKSPSLGRPHSPASALALHRKRC